MFGSASKDGPFGRTAADFKRHQQPDTTIKEPSNQETLLRMLLDMYWKGVSREIKHIIISLRGMEDLGLGYSQIEKERQSNSKIQGFDAFIDQICERPSLRANTGRSIASNNYMLTGSILTLNRSRLGSRRSPRPSESAVA
jgi:hypothetical protein